MSSKSVIWAAAALAVIGVGLGSFWGVRTLASDGSGAQAQPEPTPAPAAEPALPWWAAYFEEDARKPRFDQTINGILIGPMAPSPGYGGCQGKAELVAPERAVGTPVEVNPAYLPEGTALTSAETGACGDRLDFQMEIYRVSAKLDPNNPDVPLRSGGQFWIIRKLTTTHTFPLSEAAERMAPVTIKGRPAVFVRPVTPGGHDIGLG